MDFPSKFYDYLGNNTLIGIKAGMQRRSFLEIWMVVLDRRVFARSWNKSDKGWFTEFANSGVGEIKFGDNVVSVTARKVDRDDHIHELINQAYLLKFTQEENLHYAHGIVKPGYRDYTIEFFFDR